jgi:protein SCO1/2
MMRRSILVVGAAALVAIGGAAGAWVLRPRPTPVVQSSGSPSLGGPFTLVDTQGRTVTDRDLIGRPTVIYFGFTYCPEVCPTTLAAMTQWLKALGPDADKLNVLFVSIDPERDTPKQLGLYLSNFDSRIRGLTGSSKAVAQAAHDYNVYYQKVALDGGSYTMDHSTTVYLMDRKGQFRDVIAYKEPDADAIAKLKDLARG